MKLVIASDIHGAAGWCAKLLAGIANERPDRVVLLGDLLYHGPRNNVPTDYEPREVIAQLAAIADHVIAVRGNCDAEVDQMVLPFACMADYNVLYDPDTGRDLFLTHGHVYGPGLHGSVAKLPQLAPGTAVVYGHTHVKVNGAAHDLTKNRTAGTGDAIAEPVARLTSGGSDGRGGSGGTLAKRSANDTLARNNALAVGSDGADASWSATDLWLFNPGSVGIPKDGTHSYGVYENGVFEHRTLD